MLDAVINILVEKLVESLLNEGRHVLQFHDEFKALKKELLYVQKFLEDAEKVRVKDQKELLKLVVQELRELLYDAEDLISDCELFLKSERRKMASKCMNYCSLSFWKFRYRMGKKLSEINQGMQDVKEKMRSFLATTPMVLNQEQLGINQPVRYPELLTNDAEVVGLDDDAEKVIGWLLKIRGSFNVIGIVGMGGIGKTTLAQKIQNDENVKKDFDSFLMVTVSQTPKFDELIKNMLVKLDVKKDLANIDVRGLLEELRNRLEGKRCLIILDDVWSQDGGSWWDSLKTALPQRNSCVVVTTRQKEVARSMGATEMHIHHPQLLSDEESWSLFTKTAFGEQEGQCLNPELECIGRAIVGECKRLPLAIKVVGGMMKGKGYLTSDWRRIYENLKEELAKKGDPVNSVLEVSYQELPSHLKLCMLCLAMFPEDRDIWAIEIVPWLIGEGLVRGGGGGGEDRRTKYEIGQEYIDELMRRCLLTCEDWYRCRELFYVFRIHDLVRDMIRGIAKEENFICFNDEDKGGPSCTQTRRVGMVQDTDINFFNEIINFKSLRTISARGIAESEEFRQNMGVKLCQLKWLSVLSISFQDSVTIYDSSSSGNGGDWLSEIGSLKHLICLKLEYCGLERLPDSIGNLRKLQILCLEYCPYLKGIPRGIASLEKLTILSLYKSESVEWLPKELGNLSNLQELRGFKVGNSSRVNYDDESFCVPDLKKMTQLCVLELEIRSEDGIEEGDLKVLSELKQLRKLRLKFYEHRMESKIQHQLSPLQQLSELSFYEYSGKMTPIWLNPTTLPKLLYLAFHSCSFSHLSPQFFGEGNEDVWKLEVFVMNNVVTVKDDSWERIQKAMPFLRRRDIEDCSFLDSQSEVDGYDDSI